MYAINFPKLTVLISVAMNVPIFYCIALFLSISLHYQVSYPQGSSQSRSDSTDSIG